MKRTAFAVMLIFALLFSSVELVEMANANFMWIFAEVPPVPGTIPPSISMNKPQNNTSYSSSTVTLDFSVRSAELDGWVSFIHTVEYSLDGGNLIPVGMGSDLPELFDAAFNLTSLSSGSHSLTVTAEVVVSRGEPLAKFFLHPNSTVNFSIESADYSSTPSPSPIATLTPPPEPTSTSDLTSLGPLIPPLSMQLQVIFGAVFTVAVLGAGLGLLLYLVKRK